MKENEIVGLEVGQFRDKLLNAEDNGVVFGEGVLKFLVSRKYEGQKCGTQVELYFMTGKDLGIEKDRDCFVKNVLKKMPDKGLTECPMETAVVLANKFLNEGTAENGSYYVISRKQEGETGFGNGVVPNFLKVDVSDGKINVSGWNEKDLIPTEAKIVLSVI